MMEDAVKKMEPCIRDKDKRIIAWTVGMSYEEVEDFLQRHISEGAHMSTYEVE